MDYKIQKLDKRHSYYEFFDYYISFSNSMWVNEGPVCYSLSKKWFSDTYGWSENIRIYSNLCEWNNTFLSSLGAKLQPVYSDLTAVCNKNWSWLCADRHIKENRIYVVDDSVLSFFCLANPIKTATA